MLRGLHLQKTRPQGKLVSVSYGAVYDVAVDINPKSATFGQFVGLELNDENHLQLWIPPGYAHGFCVLSDVADFQYKCTELYDLKMRAGGDLERYRHQYPLADSISSAIRKRSSTTKLARFKVSSWALTGQLLQQLLNIV